MCTVRHITLNHQRIGASTVLDAIQSGSGGKIFFASSETQPDIQPGFGTVIDDMRPIGGSLVVSACGSDGIKLNVDGEAGTVALSKPELEFLAGKNVLLAFRNGQSAEATTQWLSWHVTRHGADAALIIDRATPNENARFLHDISKAACALPGLGALLIVQFDVPLGQPDLPAEAHPFNAPDAPGKDRMDVPLPSPWDAPLGQHSVFELLRYRFLNEARAVATLDISDLLLEEADENIFDRAQSVPGGVIALQGHHCYPWRVRNGADCQFADHICRQFDAKGPRHRWCIAPKIAGPESVWRFVRITGTRLDPSETATFMRFMGLRHPTQSVSKIVPKTSLVEHQTLLELSETLGHKPVRMPVIAAPKIDPSANSVTIITCMKNEGPFILEWIAYHRAIGVDNFLVYTNDCTDGTDDFHDLLQAKGIVQHRDNPFRDTGLKPQHAALQAGESEDIIKNADWVICMDVDEFINIKVGDGTLPDLFEAVGDANMISLTWRLFGNSDIHEYRDAPIIGDYTRCAHEMTRKPHQAWGFKTLFRNIGLFKKLGVHRPKGLNPQLWEQINWVNGSGKPMPREFFRNAWRSTQETVGYDLVSLNHYAIRSAESFLVKRDRGRVNHVDRDQGLAYWFRMNHNVDEDHSIQRMLPTLRAEMDKLLADPDIAAMHRRCVAAHRAKIDALKATENYAKFYADLTGERLERLSKLLPHFGANVFLAGPDVVPDDVVFGEHDRNYFFTVERQETTAH